MKSISVIIPAYNNARYLREAIDSALGQTCPALEVIVVDDGSKDETPALLAAYGDRIRAFRQENAGVAAARNFGVSQARGEYVAFLDADDIWDPRKLELQIAKFENEPELGLVHCALESFGDDGSIITPFLGGMEGWVAAELLRFETVIAGPGSTSMIPKRIFDEIGGFDHRLPPSEDWDLTYRIATKYRVGYVPEILLRYRIHGAGGHFNIPRMESGMMLGLAKAFSSPDPAVQSLRRFSYGRLHRILAGCYFQARNGRAFWRHALRSIRYDPRNLGYFAMYPFRALSRAFSR